MKRRIEKLNKIGYIEHHGRNIRCVYIINYECDKDLFGQRQCDVEKRQK